MLTSIHGSIRFEHLRTRTYLNDHKSTLAGLLGGAVIVKYQNQTFERNRKMNSKTMRKLLKNTNDKIPTCCCDELQSTWNSRSTKKISADRCQKKELKYYSIKYACGFGGRDNFKGRGDGSRKPPCLTAPSKQSIMLGVRWKCEFAWGGKNFAWGVDKFA